MLGLQSDLAFGVFLDKITEKSSFFFSLYRGDRVTLSQPLRAVFNQVTSYIKTLEFPSIGSSGLSNFN